MSKRWAAASGGLLDLQNVRQSTQESRREVLCRFCKRTYQKAKKAHPARNWCNLPRCEELRAKELRDKKIAHERNKKTQ